METNNYIVIYSCVNRSTGAQPGVMMTHNSTKHNYKLHTLERKNN
jgi:hypothetical protein